MKISSTLALLSILASFSSYCFASHYSPNDDFSPFFPSNEQKKLFIYSLDASKKNPNIEFTPEDEHFARFVFDDTQPMPEEINIIERVCVGCGDKFDRFQIMCSFHVLTEAKSWYESIKKFKDACFFHLHCPFNRPHFECVCGEKGGLDVAAVLAYAEAETFLKIENFAAFNFVDYQVAKYYFRYFFNNLNSTHICPFITYDAFDKKVEAYSVATNQSKAVIYVEVWYCVSSISFLKIKVTNHLEYLANYRCDLLELLEKEIAILPIVGREKQQAALNLIANHKRFSDEIAFKIEMTLQEGVMAWKEASRIDVPLFETFFLESFKNYAKYMKKDCFKLLRKNMISLIGMAFGRIPHIKTIFNSDQLSSCGIKGTEWLLVVHEMVICEPFMHENFVYIFHMINGTEIQALALSNALKFFSTKQALNLIDAFSYDRRAVETAVLNALSQQNIVDVLIKIKYQYVFSEDFWTKCWLHCIAKNAPECMLVIYDYSKKLKNIVTLKKNLEDAINNDKKELFKTIWMLAAEDFPIHRYLLTVPVTSNFFYAHDELKTLVAQKFDAKKDVDSACLASYLKEAYDKNKEQKGFAPLFTREVQLFMPKMNAKDAEKIEKLLENIQ